MEILEKMSKLLDIYLNFNFLYYPKQLEFWTNHKSLFVGLILFIILFTIFFIKFVVDTRNKNQKQEDVFNAGFKT